MALPSKMQRKDPPIQQTSLFDPPMPLPPAPPRETETPVLPRSAIEIREEYVKDEAATYESSVIFFFSRGR